MKEIFIDSNTLPEAYHNALLYLYEFGKIYDCTDGNTRQKEVSMTFVVENPLSEPRISKCFIGGPKDLEQYVQEMLDGILDFEIEKGNGSYTYHDRIVNFPSTDGDNKFYNQIEFVIDELKRNSSSRRAVIDIRNNTEDMYSEDPACLQHIQYFIRDNKLDCKVLFRSNDACKATFMNAFALIMLQKKIADKLNLEVGTYTHRANSFHCYEKDFSLLEGYVKRIKSQSLEDLTYEYVDNGDILMEESKSEIFENVKKLKDR